MQEFIYLNYDLFISQEKQDMLLKKKKKKEKHNGNIITMIN